MLLPRISGSAHRFYTRSQYGLVFTRVFLTKYSVELDGAVIMGTGFIPDSAAKIGMMLSSLICKTKGERYKSKLLESLTLGSNNKAFAPNRTLMIGFRGTKGG